LCASLLRSFKGAVNWKKSDTRFGNVAPTSFRFSFNFFFQIKHHFELVIDWALLGSMVVNKGGIRNSRVHEKEIKITKTVGRIKEDTAVSCQNSSALFALDATRMFCRAFHCFNYSDKEKTCDV